MYNLLQNYSQSNPEKFNEDLIYLKEHDTVLTHINSIFKALEVINGVEFLGSTINEDESSFPDYIKNDKHQVNIAESRHVLVDFKFRIFDNKTGEEEIIEKSLFFPKLIDKTYFILNGSKFFPIYQIIDSATYNNNGSLTLKTLLMGVTIRTRDIEFYDMDDNKYSGVVKVIDLFKNKLNYLLYFFVDRGYKNTMEYFLGKENLDKMHLILEDSDEHKNLKNENYVMFNLKNETILAIEKNLFDRYFKFFTNVIDILSDTELFQITDKDYWKLEMGKIFSRNKNNYESKANDILISFKRILDNSTKSTLRLKDENKEDIFAIVRWMVRNYDTLIYQDNMDLAYKRIRINEYLCYDLLIKMSNATYRLLNKSEITMKDRQTLFSTLTPMYILKKIGSNELLRYFGGVNAIELFNPSLKFSQRGFQGLGEGSRDVNKSYRGLHYSYPGRIGLTSSSAGDPGMSGTFTPFSKIYIDNGFYFSDTMLDSNEQDF